MSAHVITGVTPLEDFRLALEFDGFEQRVFDVSPYIRGDFYGELADDSYFRQAYVAFEGQCIAWPHDQDISPEDLYELSVAL